MIKKFAYVNALVHHFKHSSNIAQKKSWMSLLTTAATDMHSYFEVASHMR